MIGPKNREAHHIEQGRQRRARKGATAEWLDESTFSTSALAPSINVPIGSRVAPAGQRQQVANEDDDDAVVDHVVHSWAFKLKPALEKGVLLRKGWRTASMSSGCSTRCT